MTTRSIDSLGAGASVRIEWGPIFELLATASALLHTDHHPYYDLGGAWFAKVISEAPDAASRLRSFAGGSLLIWDPIFGLATEVSPNHDISSFIDHVGRMDAAVLRLELLGRHYRPVQRAVGIERIEEAAAGNASAQRDLLRLAWPEDSAWQTGVRQLLKIPPVETQKTLTALLRVLDRDLKRYLEPTLNALEADAANKRATAAALEPLALIRSAIDTAYVPTADVSAVVLVPSFVVRPFVYYFERGDQMLFLYPVAERFIASIGAGPPERLVRLAAALGDRGRLRILAALKERDKTLKELAEALGLPRSTLRHHIGVLRGAGLLRPMQSSTGLPAYQLREEAATDLAELVEKFLRGP
jgi:DNA-binding transcriptional ArsR family regulator